MKIGKRMAEFALGGGAYVGLELLYRGRSHISMFGAGGVCFLLLGQLGRARMPAALRAGCGAGVITAVELATGLAVNRRYQVWDYRGQPGNFLGQICPAYTAAWVPVAAAGMALYRLVDGEGEGEEPPSLREVGVGQTEGVIFHQGKDRRYFPTASENDSLSQPFGLPAPSGREPFEGPPV